MVTFTNEASARTGSCVYAIGEERRGRERERERKGKRRGRENRVSGSVKANKGDPPCCPFVNFCRSKQGRKEGRKDGYLDDRNFPSSDGMDDIEND